MVFVGGKLNLKGDKKKSKKGKKKKSKHSHRSKEEEGAASEHRRRSREEIDAEDDERKAAASATGGGDSSDDDDGMTEAERKALKYKLEAEKKDLEKVAKQSHRERVEVFSHKLSELTELNDIPRVSAAGNG